MSIQDLSINIMAHPARKAYVPIILKQLGMKVPVIWDEKNCVWDTRRRALEAHLAAGKKWSLTLQDDIILTEDFLEKATKFITLHTRPKRRVYSFNLYFWAQGNGTVVPAMRKGYHRGRGMKSGLAIVLATELIPDLLAYWENDPRLLRHDDSRISEFLRKRHLRTVYPAPSLVQHRDIPSLIYSPSEIAGPRQARVFDAPKLTV